MRTDPKQSFGTIDPRYMARIAVFHGQYQKEVLTNYSVNISTGGIFIESSNVMPVGTELIVKFKLPTSDKVIESHARVAWTNDPCEKKKPSLPAGMGLQFLDLSLEDLHTIRVFVDKGEFVPTW
jgi:uncharacterized protein (TIGR02266 family)